MNPQVYQVDSISYDRDTEITELRLSNGAVYRITNPAHAQIIHRSITVGGAISLEQKEWLERYRDLSAAEPSRVISTLSILRTLRAELKPKLRR